jgi:hypothetical protein
MTGFRKIALDELESTVGAHGTTYKLETNSGDGVHSLYMTVVLTTGRASYIDIRLDGTHDDSVRATMEPLCRQSYVLLRSGVWTLEHLARSWRGYKFAPMGYCPQLNSIVHSPLDAAGMLLECLIQRLKEEEEV